MSNNKLNVGGGTPGTVGSPVHPARPTMPKIDPPRADESLANGATLGNFSPPEVIAGPGAPQAGINPQDPNT